MGKPKKWEIGFSRSDAKDAVAEISSALGIKELTASLLYHRGCTSPEAARQFLRLEGTLFHDPFLLCDMERAANRLKQAIASREAICIWGDYDADGVTATCVLYSYLKHHGAVVDYFIPDRMRDGYGMNERGVRELCEKGIQLIVTVDNGITAPDQIALAYKLGMEVIVTDHHEPHGALPEACAVINPHRSDDSYPFKELAGVGVAFKLISATEMLIAKEQGRSPDYKNDLCLPYMDLVAIGTIADVVTLNDENRLVVSLGLSIAARSPRPGLGALIAQAMGSGKDLNASAVSFTLAPRINAAGRLGSAMRAVELLLAETEFEANRLAAELCETNRERQEEENGIFLSAKERIAALGAEGDMVLVLDSDNWHPGVTGIVSSRVTERYGKPSFLITYDGDIGKGSGRSCAGISLMELLAGCEDLLIQYGGHDMAAGLTVRRECVPLLRARMNALASSLCPDGIPEAVMNADCEITFADITKEQIEELRYLEPCGMGNPQPVFLLRGAILEEMTGVGSNRHTRLHLRGRDGRTIVAMYFGVAPERLDYRVGDRVDLLVQMDLNAFGGRVTPQLLVRDMDHDEAEKGRGMEVSRALDALLEMPSLPSISHLPTRNDFALAYRAIRQMAKGTELETTFRLLAGEIFGTEPEMRIVGQIKLGLILRVFEETTILQLSLTEPGVADSGTQRGTRLAIHLCRHEEKVELSRSALYRRMECCGG